MGSSGVQRPLKLVKYLRNFGWEPIIITPKPGLYSHFDDSLNEELESLNFTIYRVDAKTPFHKPGISKGLGNLPSWITKILRFFSGFWYLPDNKIGWIEPAVEKADEIWNKHAFKAIYSTAPPYSNHIIAKKLKKKYKIPVLMDFRDDWLGSHLLSFPTIWHKQKMQAIEQDVVSNADAVTAINQPMLDSINSRVFSDKIQFEVINQGFDPADFEDVKPVPKKDEKIEILYNGIFYGENQPHTFLKAISILLDDKPDLKQRIKLVFQGGLPGEAVKLINRLGIQDIIDNRGYVSHKKSITGLVSADILWFIVGHSKNKEQVMTGKLFEYLATGKPIFALIPENGSAAEVVKKYGCGFIADPHDPEEIAKIIGILLHLKLKDQMPPVNHTYITTFNRRIIAGKVAEILDSISEQ